MGAQLKSTAGPIIEKSGDLAAILTNLEEGDVLFIDEIHRMSPAIEEVLYPAMEDYNLDLMIGQGTAARSIKLELPKFTLVGATTRPGLITAPLRGRFGIVFHLDFYNIEDLQTIIVRSAGILNVEIESNGAKEIARRSRGTPRIANRLLRRVRDYAEVDYEGKITEEVAKDALNRMEVDTFGLDEVDRKLLLTIIEKFEGGPVGLGTISASIHEEKDSIEEIIEPVFDSMRFSESNAARQNGDSSGLRSSRSERFVKFKTSESFRIKNVINKKRMCWETDISLQYILFLLSVKFRNLLRPNHAVPFFRLFLYPIELKYQAENSCWL